ncbi:D-alanyl-D-alanine carboxypeptidase family protein [Blautia sp. MSJ-19]|uniref:D-alanyl-D-alanine carboxypeptidase family protein n=1 Tax=Blautia sp. MSJ-19 TaxID=2841517 RepID=UPI001C0EEC11|nr:D-alanyl-D-alanine carboxypeptidase family protein [Blautia sp. MSJ-19]MBU5481916.1 D-alanyl-D-alanine carboxypeptidase [Blautia sp. MSJ-19]
MKFRRTFFILSLLAVSFLFTSLSQTAASMDHSIQLVPDSSILSQTASATHTGTSPGDLHALSAVLMDADSGRVLFEKEGSVPRPNASTTKVLTCILALEHGKGDDYVVISSNAARQPEVRLGLRKGEQYYLEDLLYSLMLQSHNDSAVAIAEHIGGSVENFSKMMNQKAKELGCKNTHFLTPNGLDAEDSDGTHHTTAEDLALIMRYAIRSNTFLKITQTEEYSFSDLSKKRTFSVHNTNAFLHMTDGVLSGKTGYTGEAGYCYVCACKKDGKIFIVSLLGSGWPGHKTYKWQDTLQLLNYGAENYEYQTFWREPNLRYIPVRNGILDESSFQYKVYLNGRISITDAEKNKMILLGKTDVLQYQIRLKDELTAPVKKGEQVGQVVYTLNHRIIASYPVVAADNVQKNTFIHCARVVFKNFFH